MSEQRIEDFLGRNEVVCTWIQVSEQVPLIPPHFMRTDEVYLVNAGGETIPAFFVAGQPGSSPDRWDFRPVVQHARHWVRAVGTGYTEDLIIDGVLEWMALPKSRTTSIATEA